MKTLKNTYISSSPEFQCKIIGQNGSLAPISATASQSSINSGVNFQSFQIENYFDNNSSNQKFSNYYHNSAQLSHNAQIGQQQHVNHQQNNFSNNANLFGKNGGSNNKQKFGYSQSVVQNNKNHDNLNVYDDQQSSSSESDEQTKEHRPSPYDEVIQRAQKVYPVSIKDFKLLKVLGKGSFGTVLLVRKIETGRVYAMKVIKKKKLRNKTQVQRTLTQRAILGKLVHPNIVKLHFAFQSSKKLHFCLDYCQGGELFYHLQKRRRLPGNMVKFYVANIVLALDYMHQLNIVYRDLKPENVLIGFDGYAMIADFGLSKQDIMGNHGCLSFVGTAQYLAPEILKRTGHGKAVDWWSLGAITYEMLTGLPPFYSSNRQNLFKDILCSQLRYPNFIEPAAKDFIRRLLIKDSSQRLGSKGVENVKKHPWLADIDWQAMYNKESKPPFLPEITSEEDYRHFDTAFTNQSPHSHSSNSSPATLNDPDGLLQDWKGFSYTQEKMYFDCEGENDNDNSDNQEMSMDVQIKASGLEQEDEQQQQQSNSQEKGAVNLEQN